METTDNFRSFEDLDVWKHCRELKKKYEQLAKSLPPEKKYRLSDQIIRSARSTTQNIAEGYGRFLLSGEHSVLPDKQSIFI